MPRSSWIHVLRRHSASGNAIVTADDGVLVVAASVPPETPMSPGPARGHRGSAIRAGGSRPAAWSSVNLSGNSTQTINPAPIARSGVEWPVDVQSGRTSSPAAASITGNAIVTGSNVMLYNAGSNVGRRRHPTYGGIAIGGNGNAAHCPNTGPYPAYHLQARDNTRAMSMGTTITGFTG